MFLTAAYVALFLWHLLHWKDGRSIIWPLMGLRFVVAGSVAVAMLSKVPLTKGQVRAAEYVLFGTLTLILMISQYAHNLEFIRQRDVPGMVAFVKNGVIQAFALMMLYGTFIPNDPKATARVVIPMAVGILAAWFVLAEQARSAQLLEDLWSVERGGANVLFLAIGAAMAVYGSHVLNSLRCELHEARKFGQYQLVRKLGAGGMGEVYLAEHQLLKRPCALKLIHPSTGSNPVALARFEREVRTAARLSHPNSIEIFDYGHTDDGTFYYVMEYLHGMSLDDLVERYGPLPPGRVIYLLRQVCAGLARAHALGLIHRDLKPANIYVAIRGGESDVAKVLDFGLVKLTADPTAPALTGEHHVSGTPLYMAPEQATGARDLDARLDIYALGATAYFALTGRPPFVGDSSIQVMMAHARDPVEPPSMLRADIPHDLEMVVLTCLAKRPDDRYPDVKSLSRALAACASAADWDADKADLWWTDVVKPSPIGSEV
jgi:serine/threonine-protein kinase